MYWTLELASYLEDAPWPATKEELIDYAMRAGAPLEVVENLQQLEDEEEGKPITQSKRGRFYLEYIKKHGKKLPGDWSAEISKDMFVIRNGKWSSTDPNKFINL